MSICGFSLRFFAAKTNMKARERPEAILKLWKKGKSIRAIKQTLVMADTIVWNVLKKEETTGELGNKHCTATMVNGSNIVRAAKKKNPKTPVSVIAGNLHWAGVTVT